jgi:Spy/CpxP family protein refolding chaperone
MKLLMKLPMVIPIAAIPIALGAAALVCSGAPHHAQAQTSGAAPPSSLGEGGETHKLALTQAQRRAIYAAVSNDKSKTAPTQFPAKIGADVPPMIQLYALPDQVLAENQTAEFYECTMVQDKVVLVDPTKMRVVDVIGPPPQ